MVTVAEIARNIGIPATTAREYVARFRSFFPTRKVTGKRYPMHPNSAEEVMRDIVNAYARNITTDEVMNYLKEKHPMAADIVDDDEGQIKSSSPTSAVATAADNSALELLTHMSNMQMQLMQRMTDVLDRNNHVMERMINVLDRDREKPAALKAPEAQPMSEKPKSPQSKTETPQEQNTVMINTAHEYNGTQNTAQSPQEPIPTVQPQPIPQPKKFIMPTKEEMEKRKNKGWLSRMFGA